MRPIMELAQALESKPRRIPSKFFYDANGTRLFSHITELASYYPTRCEQEILDEQSQRLMVMLPPGDKINIVELGAGDGRKIGSLLESARGKYNDVTYRPVDISLQALQDLEARLKTRIPGLTVEPSLIDIENDWHAIPFDRNSLNLVLFLGSSIGNFMPPEQQMFLSRIRSVMGPHDYLCIGFDLKKDPHILQQAYDDPEGVTREFNMNLLRRFNREFDADFDEHAFEHIAAYNPATGSMESWLVSQREQTVHLPKLKRQLHLDAYEGIQVETSWKFSRREIEELARSSGFEPVSSLYDRSGWFVDDLWTVEPIYNSSP